MYMYMRMYVNASLLLAFFCHFEFVFPKIEIQIFNAAIIAGALSLFVVLYLVLADSIFYT